MKRRPGYTAKPAAPSGAGTREEQRIAKLNLEKADVNWQACLRKSAAILSIDQNISAESVARLTFDDCITQLEDHIKLFFASEGMRAQPDTLPPLVEKARISWVPTITQAVVLGRAKAQRTPTQIPPARGKERRSGDKAEWSI